MNIVCFGQQNWDVCWTGKQQLMTRLARRGHRVLYVDPVWTEEPGSPGDLLRSLAPVRSGLGLREEGPGELHVYTYPYAPPLRWRLNVRRWPRVVRALTERLGLYAPVAVSLRPEALPLVAALRPRAFVYYAVDEMTAFGHVSEEEKPRIRAREETMLRAADLALAVSPRLHARFREVQPRSYLLENGADTEHFAPRRLARAAPHPEVARLPGPKIGFVGQVDDRLDQPLLVHMARAHPEWHVVLAGRIKTGVDVSALTAEPNVHLLGYQPYDDLPGVLREVDACIVPYRLTELTHACNPLKVFEYLATGRPVVSTPLEGLRACRGAVALADTPESFTRAVEAALAEPERGREARLAVAAGNAWDERVDDLERYLEEAVEVAETAGRRRSGPRGGLRGGSGGGSGPWRPAESHAGDRLSPAGRAAFAGVRAAGWLYYGARMAGRIAAGRTPADVRRILVVRQTLLGDLVVFLPFLAALRERYPHARIVLGVQPGMSAGAVLGSTGYVDEVRVLDHLSRPSAAARLAGALRLFLEGFDLVVSGARWFVLREAFYTGAPRRIGILDGHPLQTLNSRVVPLDPTRHEAENNLALVEALGGQVEETRRHPVLPMELGGTARDAEHLLDRLGIPAEAEILALHPGSQKPSRRWPAERLAELATRLLAGRPSLRVVFTGVPVEEALVEGVRARIPEPLRERAPSSVGMTDLSTLVAFLERCRAFVCNDTGVMHLARARGVPLVALLGPENDRRWGPHPLGPGPAIALRHEVPCAPCTRWDCEGLYCLRSLSVDEVQAAVEQLLDDPPGADGAPVALDRRLRRHGWGELAGAGFALPSVTVVVLPTGRGDVAGVERALAAVRRQDYPDVEVVVVDPPRGWAREVGEGILPTTVARSRGGGPEAVWRAALEAGRGELFSVADVAWRAGQLSDDVAALVRDPGAPSAGGERDAEGIPTPGVTVRRTALEGALAGAGTSLAGGETGVHRSPGITGADVWHPRAGET